MLNEQNFQPAITKTINYEKSVFKPSNSHAELKVSKGLTYQYS